MALSTQEQIMLTKEQERLHKSLRVNQRIAERMGISVTQLKAKINSIKLGNNPIIKNNGNPQAFKPLYIQAQKDFYRDLVQIALCKLEELEGGK